MLEAQTFPIYSYTLPSCLRKHAIATYIDMWGKVKLFEKRIHEIHVRINHHLLTVVIGLQQDYRLTNLQI